MDYHFPHTLVPQDCEIHILGISSNHGSLASYLASGKVLVHSGQDDAPKYLQINALAPKLELRYARVLNRTGSQLLEPDICISLADPRGNRAHFRVYWDRGFDALENLDSCIGLVLGSGSHCLVVLLLMPKAEHFERVGICGLKRIPFVNERPPNFDWSDATEQWLSGAERRTVIVA